MKINSIEEKRIDCRVEMAWSNKKTNTHKGWSQERTEWQDTKVDGGNEEKKK